MADSQLQQLLASERIRQQDQISLIPSENYVSSAVLSALGSCVVNKYSEGYPGKRYYQGNTFIDEIETLAQVRALKLFKLDPSIWHVNVQAFNGSAANLAVLTALVPLHSKILSMALTSGGHLSHGWRIDDKPISLTGKLYDSLFYEVDPISHHLDYDQIKDQAVRTTPKILISGGTSYSREVNHNKMGEIAHAVNAFYLADIAHEAGLVASGLLESPFEQADVVTMTTRKTLRGPIGALIFCRKDLAGKIDRALFPGIQGGPPNHQIAGIAQALFEASQSEYNMYSVQVLKNAQVLSTSLNNMGYKIISGGTDKHLMVVDMTNKELDGWCVAIALEAAGIIVNRSTIPFDLKPPYYPSGIRLGTPAVTTRGMKEKEMKWIVDIIDQVIKITQKMNDPRLSSEDQTTRQSARKEFKDKIRENNKLGEIDKDVKLFCSSFPIP